MKTKIIAFLIGFIPFVVSATSYDDALNSHNQEYRHVTQGVDNGDTSKDWSNNVRTPNNQTTQIKMTSKTWHLNPPSDSVKTITLESSSTYTCAISRIGGYYGRGLKGFDARVYKSGSRWKMTVGKNCGGCDNWADAVCWRLQ